MMVQIVTSLAFPRHEINFPLGCACAISDYYENSQNIRAGIRLIFND